MCATSPSATRFSEAMGSECELLESVQSPSIKIHYHEFKIRQSSFLCVFLHPYSGAGVQAQSGGGLNLTGDSGFAKQVATQKRNKGVEDVCKGIIIMNDHGISAGMEIKDTSRDEAG